MIGRVISHYRVLDKLGEGGMGVVYRAEDLRLKRHVALKFLNEGNMDEGQRKRFLREAQAAAALQHPNICTIFEADEVDGHAFLAMALIEGRPLSSVIRDGPIPPDRAVHLARQMAEAMAEAHRRGVIHRDLKAGNIMVTDDDRAVVLDFGLAQFAESGSRITKTGATVGTAAYMSPEQAQGDPLDTRTDVWSLGVILYEMLSGKLPFRGDYELAVMYNIVHTDPAALEGPPVLLQIIERALCKDPDDRFHDARELAAALAPAVPPSAADLSTAVASPVVRVSSKIRQAHKRPNPALALGLVAAVVVAALIVWFYDWDRLATGAAGRVHLAVLPFTGLGEENVNNALTDGLVETLSGKLTEAGQMQESRLSVVPSSELRAEDVASVQSARRLFDINFAITGSVQSTPQGVRVIVNLVDAVALRQIDSTTVDWSDENASELQDGVIYRVIQMLERRLQVDASRALSVGGTSEPRAYQLYLEGVEALARSDRKDNVGKAIEALAAAMEADAQYAPAQVQLAEAYWQRFNQNGEAEWAEKATAMAERAVRTNENLAAAHAKLGHIYRRLGRYDDAKVELNRALEIDPLDPDARSNLGLLFHEQGDFERAESLLLEAVRLRPDSWRAYLDLAMLYERNSRYEQALEQYTKSIDLAPRNPLMRRNLAVVYLRLGRTAEARAEVQRAIEIEPTAGAYDLLGSLEYFSGRYEEAVDAYQAAVEQQPRNRARWGNLAEAQRWVPKYEQEARNSYAKAIELSEQRLSLGSGKEPRTLQWLALYRARVGDIQGAFEAWETIPEAARETGEMQYVLASIYEMAGDRDAVLKTVRKALELGYPVDQLAAGKDFEALASTPAGKQLLEKYKASDQ